MAKVIFVNDNGDQIIIREKIPDNLEEVIIKSDYVAVKTCSRDDIAAALEAEGCSCTTGDVDAVIAEGVDDLMTWNEADDRILQNAIHCALRKKTVTACGPEAALNKLGYRTARCVECIHYDDEFQMCSYYHESKDPYSTEICGCSHMQCEEPVFEIKYDGDDELSLYTLITPVTAVNENKRTLDIETLADIAAEIMPDDRERVLEIKADEDYDSANWVLSPIS